MCATAIRCCGSGFHKYNVIKFAFAPLANSNSS